MRQPSDNLIDFLLEQKLCTRHDVERCEPCVRRLCHDLPDFDSVWLDALVQNHVLTSWQADRQTMPPFPGESLPVAVSRGHSNRDHGLEVQIA